ncbi:GNAT family N-acetyltransferase [Halomarina pelagica]|uniref:GNAT family N-acetyltransferase n=1 Tax=Halomarina pelagica TaxID=2961599 RepID=UPI0020C48CD0|nr:GNAT family protein [Halomarina sp. BND7]
MNSLQPTTDEAAIACYESCGFRREGVLRDARRFEDDYRTLVQMSVLEAEWRATSARRSARR